MEKVTKRLMSKHVFKFAAMTERVIENGNLKTTLSVIIDELFADGKVNWGRIATVYAFSTVLVKTLKEEQLREREGDELASIVGTQVGIKCGRWIVRQGGWKEFVACFDVYENIVLNELMSILNLIASYS
jgi:hypothetical protein